MSSVPCGFATVLPPSSVTCSCFTKYQKSTPTGPTVGCLLVTSAGNVLRFYDVLDAPPSSANLVLRSEHNLSGNVSSLHPLPSSLTCRPGTDVSLLISFSHPASTLSLSTLDSTTGTLRGTSVASFVEAVRAMGRGMEGCADAEAVVDVDPSASCVAACLGGGVGVVCVSLGRDAAGGARLEEGEFVLNLRELANLWVEEEGEGRKGVKGRNDDPERKRIGTKGASDMSTGFGDITGLKFLSGYSSPTLAILHHPKGRTWSGMKARMHCACAVTVVSVSVPQRRAVVIWRNAVLPSDTQYISPIPGPSGAVLAVAENSVHYIEPGGTVRSSLAVNGYACSSLAGMELYPRKFMRHPAYSGAKSSSISNAPLTTNPRPLRRLKARMGGSHVAFVSPVAGAVVMRSGDVYSLEVHENGQVLSMSPTEFRAPTPSTVAVLPLARNLSKGKAPDPAAAANAEKYGGPTPQNLESVGLMFVGGKLGDSSLVAYGQSSMNLSPSSPSTLPLPPSKRKRELEDANLDTDSNPLPPLLCSDSDLHDKLLKEEKALYEGADVKEEEATNKLKAHPKLTLQEWDRPTISSFYTFSFKVNDTLTQTGPLGHSVMGPTVNPTSPWPGKLYPERIFCSGYGRDGGISILSTPGSSSSSNFLADVDVRDIDDVFCLPEAKAVVLSKRAGGSMYLKSISDSSLEEAEPDDVFAKKPGSSLSPASYHVLACLEAHLSASKAFAFFVVSDGSASKALAYSVSNSRLTLASSVELPDRPKSVSLKGNRHDHTVGLACVADDGSVKAFIAKLIRSKVVFSQADVEFPPTCTAANVFLQNDDIFEGSGEASPPTDPAAFDDDGNDPLYRQADDDMETASPMNPETAAAYSLSSIGVHDVEPSSATLYVAVADSEGSLTIYDLISSDLVYTCPSNLAFNPLLLSPDSKPSPPTRNSTFSTVTELCFFVAGSNVGPAEMRSFYLIVRNSLEDVALYATRKMPASAVVFAKCSMGTVIRPVKNAKRPQLCLPHFERSKFRTFEDVSGHSGLFASLARPFWVLNERGGANFLPQKVRFADHTCASPVAGFAEVPFLPSASGTSSFVTVSERVGGSQRLTAIGGLDEILKGNGYITSGVHVRKVPLGVTVRKIEYLDHEASTNRRPLYVLLVSVDEEVDMSGHDDDGLTDQERYEARLDKNRQVLEDQINSDLKGHDDEFQDWVEEYRRTDYLELNSYLGRCPNYTETKHEVWLVEGTTWLVLQKISMKDEEHATCVELVKLTEEEAAQERAEREAAGNFNVPSRVFLVVGTSTVSEAGEEAPAVGRILLYNIVVGKPEGADGPPAVSLSLEHERASKLGPVSSLASLDCGESIHLIVGAGNQVSIMSWKKRASGEVPDGGEQPEGSGSEGSGLTQIGFHHAMSHVISIKVVKTYILLCDAYEGLQFLCWKEKEKTLTLLSRDYCRTPTFAAGVITRAGGLAFVVHDERENIRVLQYAPNDPAAEGGAKLCSRADMHVGLTAVEMSSHFCVPPEIVASANSDISFAALKGSRFDGGGMEEVFGLAFGSIDGGFACVVPLPPQIFMRLQALQNILANALDSPAACSTRGWRLYRKYHLPSINEDVHGSVLDVDLLLRFINLDQAMQEEICAAGGTTVEMVKDNLVLLSAHTGGIL